MKNDHIDLADLLEEKALLLEIRELLARDAFAATFQSLGSYRTYLLQHIRNNQQARAQIGAIPRQDHQ